MIAVDDKLMNSWQELLDGVISVPVFIEGSVPEEYNGNYVELRVESETEDDTKHSFRSDLVIITDIVTRFHVSPNRSVASAIDSEIKNLVRPSPGINGLLKPAGVQILHVIASDAAFFPEYSTGVIYYRKIVRYTHKIVQN